MKKSMLTIALALGLSTAGIAAAEVLRSESEVRAVLRDEGFVDVANVELNGGLWLAEGLDANGNPVTLRIDPQTARVVSEVREVPVVTGTAKVTTTTTTTTTRRPATPPPTRVVTEVREVPVPVAVTRATPMDAAEARAALVAAGYSDIHDLSYRNGKWKAEAEDATGDDREVHVDGFTGQIVHVEDD
jgi:uncharacterized membrane protein YkoI